MGAMPLERAAQLHIGQLATDGSSAYTRSKYKGIAEMFDRWLREAQQRPATVADLEPSILRRWQGYLIEHDRSHETAGQYLSYLRGLSRWLATPDADDGVALVRRDQLRGLRIPKREPPPISIFTDDDVDALLRATLATRNPLRNRAMVLLLLDTGLRVGEATVLKLGDIEYARPDSGQGRLIVRRGKGGRARDIPIPFGLKANRALFRYVEQERGDRPHDWLWAAQGGGRWTEPRVRQLFDVLADKARIFGKRVSPHTCRHTWATNAARDGLSPLLIQHILGHTSLDMTRRYTRVATLVDAGYRSHMDGLGGIK